MPNLKLTNLKAYKDYFADIAAQHIDIKDFKWGEKKVVENDNVSDLKSPFLWALPYPSAQYADSGSDNQVKNKVANIAYLEVRDSENFADEDEQYDRCEAQMEQIIARIIRDKKGIDVAGAWTMLATRIESFKTSPARMTIGSTVYLGYELEMTFIDNANFAFDPQKWNDTKTP